MQFKQTNKETEFWTLCSGRKLFDIWNDVFYFIFFMKYSGQCENRLKRFHKAIAVYRNLNTDVSLEGSFLEFPSRRNTETKTVQIVYSTRFFFFF